MLRLKTMTPARGPVGEVGREPNKISTKSSEKLPNKVVIGHKTHTSELDIVLWVLVDFQGTIRLPEKLYPARHLSAVVDPPI